jgi:hypothetical protein
MESIVHPKTKSWPDKLKDFPDHRLPEWSTKDDGPYFKAYMVHRDFQKDDDEVAYRSRINNFFYFPLHVAILKRATSKGLQHFLRIVYKGHHTTLLEKITEALYDYHIIKDGENMPPYIVLTLSDLYRLGTNPEDFSSVMEELNLSLSGVVVIKYTFLIKKGKFLSTFLTVFLPDTDCTMDFVQESKMLA